MPHGSYQLHKRVEQYTTCENQGPRSQDLSLRRQSAPGLAVDTDNQILAFATHWRLPVLCRGGRIADRADEQEVSQSEPSGDQGQEKDRKAGGTGMRGADIGDALKVHDKLGGKPRHVASINNCDEDGACGDRGEDCGGPVLQDCSIGDGAGRSMRQIVDRGAASQQGKW